MCLPPARDLKADFFFYFSPLTLEIKLLKKGRTRQVGRTQFSRDWAKHESNNSGADPVLTPDNVIIMSHSLTQVSVQ